MSEHVPEPAHRSNRGTGTPWSRQLLMTAVLLVVFLALGVLMIVTADTPDPVWKNRIVIFSAFQALVFGGVGWLFGREVNRVPAEIARVEAREAKELAQENADEAAEARVRAAAEETRGRALASAVTATAASTNGDRARRRTAASSGPPAPPSPQMAALAAMADGPLRLPLTRLAVDRPRGHRDARGGGRVRAGPAAAATEAEHQPGRHHRGAQPHGAAGTGPPSSTPPTAAVTGTTPVNSPARPAPSRLTALYQSTKASAVTTTARCTAASRSSARSRVTATGPSTVTPEHQQRRPRRSTPRAATPPTARAGPAPAPRAA